MSERAGDAALGALARAGIGRALARDGSFREALPFLEAALPDIVRDARAAGFEFGALRELLPLPEGGRR